jgi:hypothetical protein
MIQFEDVTHLFDVDWDKIKAHVRYLEQNVPIAGDALFGGWSILSKTGLHTEGWFHGAAYYRRRPDGTIYFDAEAARSKGFIPNNEQTEFTNASCPELEHLINQVRNLGFVAYRARIIQIQPGNTSSRHTDGMPDKLVLRLHVIIETNPGAHFITDTEHRHLEEHKIFLINVNEYHRVRNMGDTVRTHLIIEVEDKLGVSKVHK